MKPHLKPLLSLFCAATLALTLAGCGGNAPAPTSTPSPEPTTQPTAAPAPVTESDIHTLLLSGHSATLDGEAVPEYDYTWHCDPAVSHDEVKNAPAEYHTGTQPDTNAAAYIDSDLAYYPALPESGFTLVSYDGEQEWAYYYTDGEHDDYIFATLPRLGNALPADMMHTEAEAAENRVLHITRPGTYSVEGAWSGQLRIELGDPDEVFADETQKITLILNGADITCTVAPGVVFYSAYETDNQWESRETSSEPYEMDAADAGVTVLLAEGTENTVTGTNVFRMLKTKYKDEDSTDAVKTQKKQRKTDAAFYSYVSMTIDGGGSLTVTSGFEGLDSELHLTILGGNITVNSQDDGINVNEDYVSTVRFAGGEVTLNPAQGAEGDGVDSNGFIVLDGGTLQVNGVRPPDSALDSECGVTYRGGTVVIDGETQEYTPGSVFRESGMGNPGFGGEQPPEPPQGGFGGQPMDGEQPPEPPQGGFGGQPMDGEQPPEPPQGGRPQ